MRDYDQNVIEMPASTPAASDLIVDFWMRAAKDGWGFRWAVALADTDDFAGMLGFNSLTDCSEIAYHLLSKHWGKGIMTEACQAAIDWQRGNGASEIEAFIDPENTSSIALARRLEMRPSDEFSDGAQRYRMTL